MSRPLSRDETDRQLEDLPGWSFLRHALHATYDAPDTTTAVRLVAAVVELADELGHRVDVDLRGHSVRLELATPSERAVTQLDIELAHRISREADAVAAAVSPTRPSSVEVAVDALDRPAVIPFWRAGLGYADDPRGGDDPQLEDPSGRGPVLWFQQMSAPREQRNRIHVDVYVPRGTAEQRVADTLAAGGRLVTDEFAPSWWVLADAEGNELCVCVDD